MILAKLQEALAEIPTQRKALDEVEAQLRVLIAKLSGAAINGGVTSSAEPVRVRVFAEGERDRLDEIADVLRAEGKPLHITIIAQRLSEALGTRIERSQIEPGMNRHIQKAKRKRLTRVAPSTFGLPEWEANQALLEQAS